MSIFFNRRCVNILYNNISIYAEKRGVSIRELERRCELSHGTIRKWADAEPSWSSLEKVAKALKVSARKLYYEDASKEVTP